MNKSREKALVPATRICRTCRESKLIAEFTSRIRIDIDGNTYRQYELQCKVCGSNETSKRASKRYENSGLCWCGRPRELQKSRCDYCREKLNERRRRNKSQRREEGKAYRLRIKKLVFEKYGHKCACCGDTTYEFLEVDHVGGWGNTHTNSSGKKMAGLPLYMWIIRNEFPKDIFRLLCGSCHGAISYHGYCPHGNLPEALPPKPEDTEIPPLAPAPHRYQL